MNIKGLRGALIGVVVAGTAATAAVVGIHPSSAKPTVRVNTAVHSQAAVDPTTTLAPDTTTTGAPVTTVAPDPTTTAAAAPATTVQPVAVTEPGPPPTIGPGNVPIAPPRTYPPPLCQAGPNKGQPASGGCPG